MADPYESYSAAPGNLGTKGAFGTANGADFDPVPKAIEVVAEGTLSVLPVNNADGAFVDLGTKPSGYQPPWRVRAVAAGSTATFVKVWD